MSRRRNIRRCRCGQEIPIGRRQSTYCSEDCMDKYGTARSWDKDMSPESKADTAIKTGLNWVQQMTREQLIDWYKRG